ncbi:unnamed protein product, partial [marine sediment metagenome]
LLPFPVNPVYLEVYRQGSKALESVDISWLQDCG